MATSAKMKVRKYSLDYLKYGFLVVPHDERLPLCLLCEQTLYDDSMKCGIVIDNMNIVVES